MDMPSLSTPDWDLFLIRYPGTCAAGLSMIQAYPRHAAAAQPPSQRHGAYRRLGLACWKMTKSVTLDTNCLIDLELGKGAAKELRVLLASHDQGDVTVRVPAIGASERTKSGYYAETFSVFEERVRRLTSRPLEILRPVLYWGIGYWDWGLWASDEMTELDRQIHQILFPHVEFRWQDFAAAHGLDAQKAIADETKEWRQWRNRKCDTLGMWCHIYYKGDIFVTRDANFHKKTKKPELIKLGAKSILYPPEALALLP